MLTDASRQIGGGRQVHNRGTIGGEVCGGKSVYDYLPCLVALEAEFLLRSHEGTRTVRAPDFFEDEAVVDRRSDELLTGIRLPTNNVSSGMAYEKLTFSDGCYCIASAASVLTRDEEGTVTGASLCLGGVEPTPTPLPDLEQELTGSRPDQQEWENIPSHVEEAVHNPISDAQADGEYRRAMAGVMMKRSLQRSINASTNKATT